MNWTGGRLQRHSRNSAGKSLNFTQKQHFAKVRNRLQNGPRAASPLDFSLLHVARDARKGRESERDNSELESRPKRQKTLSEYATTAALANRLNAMKPRQVSQGGGTSSELRYGAKRPKADDAFAQHEMSTEYRTSRDSDASVQYQTEAHRNDGHEVGLRSEPGSSRPKFFRTTLMSNNSATKPESLEEKRQSLLQQDNWVCTAVTRPLKINFPDSNDRQKVGRRRRISTEKRSRHNLPVRRRFRPSIQEGLLPEGSDWDDRGGREDISVRIGGQVHGSQRTTLRGMEEVFSQSQHQSLSSESMLLDREDTWYGLQGRVDLSPRTSLLGQRLVQRDALGQSRTDARLLSVLSGTSDAFIDERKKQDKLQPYLYERVEEEEEQGYTNFPISDELYSDTERSEASHKSSLQSLGHHQQADIAEEHSTQDTDGITSMKRCDPLAPRMPAFKPLRLIFDSTPRTTTSQVSDFGAVSVHNTQAIRSTVVEVSDDTNDAVIKDSDEIEWEKLIMLDNTHKVHTHSKLLLSETSNFNENHGSNQPTPHVVTAQGSGIDRTGGIKPNLWSAAEDQRMMPPVDEMPDNGVTRLQTEDEIWMRFLDISGHAEEEDQENKTMTERQSLKRFESSDTSELPVADRELDNGSILAQASSSSFTRTIVESPSLPSTKHASDEANWQIDGPMERTSSPSPYVPIRSTVATVNTSPPPFPAETHISTAATGHTSSPGALEASKSATPSIAAATVHCSSSDLLLPSTAPAPPQSDMSLPRQSQASSPDPLTLTSPSAHVGLRKDGQAAEMQPPRQPRVLFTKPKPFTGRQVSASTIHKASREPLRLGRTIAGSSLKSKSAFKDAKGTSRTGMRKGKDKGRVAGRAAARSIYSIPSTDSDIEDGPIQENATESIEDDDNDLSERI